MTTTADILRLPSGRELRVPDGMTVDEVFWRHVALSASEGICPDHGIPLTPIRGFPGSGVVAAGHCRLSGAYWSVQADGAGVWDIDHDPHTGEPMVPWWADQEGSRP